ncbi:MSMEG_0567/Sll0786 family nitrogen starvation N-acetyltransferase [Aeromicrobium sp.]|uniref:MSMEG_0567/Sll0786 family nitrogen starvation N-acetyltransferase n=1 Tax=Aeromicrobium sp. TaxID=1871063 RepID=UPI0030C46B49
MQSELNLTDAAVPEQALRGQPLASTGIVCRQARSAAERADHLAIRHRIFVDEQAVFAESDLDAHDQDGSAIALLGYHNGVAAGTVRLFLLDRTAGLWQGDRLAVLSPYRTRGLGVPLVRCAVATAAARGGQRMIAHIQLPNIAFFQRLGWTKVGDAEIYAGLVHQPMSIELPTQDEGIAIVGKLAAGVNARDL